MNGWDDIAKHLPPGLDGALEPGGLKNGVIPTGFDGLEFEVVDEFDLIVERASGEERRIGDDATVGWVVDKVLRAWLAETGFYNHLIVDAGRVFWFNPDDDPEQARLLVDVWSGEEKTWRETRIRLDDRARLIAYRRVRRWVGGMLRFWTTQSPLYTVTTVDKEDERTEFRIWDREHYLPVKVVTAYSFGRVEVRPAPDGKPDAIEFCPGGRPTGLSKESEDAVKGFLLRVKAGLGL